MACFAPRRASDLSSIPPHEPVFILERSDQRADSAGIADLAQGFGRMAPYHPVITQQPVDQGIHGPRIADLFSTRATSSCTV